MQDTEVVTLGCRLNAFEAEVMRQNARAMGLRDTIIVNTCTVTAEATRQARQTIRRARRDNPGARIVVTGCAAQIDPHSFAAMEEVDRVLGNAEKLDQASFDPAAFGADDERIAVSDIMAIRETAGHLVDGPVLNGFENRTRAFVQIQQGCDHRCTFCIIPFARGPNRSVPAERVVEQVRTLATNGYREVVLTGVDICSYGTDMAGRPSLGGLVRIVLDAVPELRRLRLSSLDPAMLDDDVITLLGDEPRLMPHLHLSMQAGDDMVLKRMNRRHSADEARALRHRVLKSRPDVVFGADLIAGFPTETEAMFENTLNAIDELGLVHLHVFPYSSRPGTPAARMPEVPASVRKERAALLRQAGARALDRFLVSQIGATTDVLIEDRNAGRSPHYAPVHLDRDMPAGAIVSTRIKACADGHLIGQPAA